MRPELQVVHSERIGFYCVLCIAPFTGVCFLRCGERIEEGISLAIKFRVLSGSLLFERSSVYTGLVVAIFVLASIDNPCASVRARPSVV